MKIKFRVLQMFLVIAVLLAIGMNDIKVFAKNIEDNTNYIGEGTSTIFGSSNILIPNSELVIDAVEVCNGYAKHDMVSHGWGTVYKGVYPDTSNLVFNGTCWQCSRCNEVLMTEYDPLITNYVGHYALWNPGYKLSSISTVVWTNIIYFTSGASVPYCVLR